MLVHQAVICYNNSVILYLDSCVSAELTARSILQRLEIGRAFFISLLRGTMKRFFGIMIVALLALIVLAVPVQAEPAIQSVDPGGLPIDINSFLQWLIGGGGSIMAVSWILERMAWFQALGSDQKDYVLFTFAAALGCGALAVVTYVPAAILDAVAPFFLIVASIFVLVFIAKTFHMADRKNPGLYTAELIESASDIEPGEIKQ